MTSSNKSECCSKCYGMGFPEGFAVPIGCLNPKCECHITPTEDKSTLRTSANSTSPKESWDKDLKTWLKVYVGDDTADMAYNSLKSFISETLKAEREALKKQIEDMKKEIEEGFTGKYSRMDKGYNEALDDIIKLL